MNKQVKKLWKGQFVSIRDYEIEKAKSDGLLRISFGDSTMTLGSYDLDKLQPSSRIFKSKTGGKDYRLVDIKFIPDQNDDYWMGIKGNKQQNLFDG